VHRVVLAGCGNITRAWLGAIADFDDVQIVGLVDLRPEAIARVKEAYDLEPLAEGAELLPVIEATGAEIVFDCTLPSAHAAITLTALEQGCHVLGEKPMAATMDEARRMVARAAEAGRTYAVIQNRRYMPEIVAFRDALRDGHVGSLTTLNADFYIGAHFGGFRDSMEHVLLLDMAIHSFDQARFISGCDPVSVYCHEWNPPGSWYRHGASAVAVFQMTGGVVFTYRGSWCAEGLNTSWECQWRAVGEEGTLTWDGAESFAGQRITGSEGFRRPLEDIAIPGPQPMTHTRHAGVIRDFLDSLESGRKPLTDCGDNIRSLAMVHAAIESARSGRVVPVRWD
jgi:predicted dehydrogenase